MQTQLLCTFCDVDSLDATLALIAANYEVALNSIYVLQNVDDVKNLCCTYNVVLGTSPTRIIPKTTISLHRKKATNTLYTINALNLLVASLNNGRLDRNFKLPWEDYSNCILVTAQDQLKRINTKLYKIVRLTELGKTE